MANYNPKIHNRRSIRLKGYDYTRPGAYFITICTQHRRNILGEVIDGAMVLNPFGEIVLQAWHDLPNHYPHVVLDEFCIMPNHLHAIIVMTEPQQDADPEKKRHALPEVVRALKSFSARRINLLRGTPGIPVWQRNYFDRIVWTDRALFNIRRYICDNPLKWATDPDNPINRRRD